MGLTNWHAHGMTAVDGQKFLQSSRKILPIAIIL